MAYNNGFPIGYQPMNYPQYQPNYPQQNSYVQPNQQNQSQVINSGIVWVSGETGAKSYLLSPNTTLPLWDSERQTIYLKSADASGMPSMKILDYTIREQAQPQNIPVVSEQAQQKVDFVTHDELKDFEQKITHKIDEIKEEVGA